MKMTRRQFMQTGVATAVATAFPALSEAKALGVVKHEAVEAKVPTDLSYYFGSKTEWNRAGYPGDLPEARNENNPANAANIAKLKAEKKATIFTNG